MRQHLWSKSSRPGCAWRPGGSAGSNALPPHAKLVLSRGGNTIHQGTTARAGGAGSKRDARNRLSTLPTARVVVNAIHVAPPRASAPLVLQQPAVRAKQSASGKRAAAKRNSKANLWWCTCLPQWPPAEDGGRQWHHLSCERRQFASHGEPAMTLGKELTIGSSAGPRAGQKWRCVKVTGTDYRSCWERVG